MMKQDLSNRTTYNLCRLLEAERILTTHDKTRPILHDDWSIRLGENRPDWTLKHLVAMLSLSVTHNLCESGFLILDCLQ